MRFDRSWQVNDPPDKENACNNRPDPLHTGRSTERDENLRVLLRLRPIEAGRTSCIQVGPPVNWRQGTKTSRQLRITEEKRAHEFMFDTVCGPESSNLDIWNISARRVVDSFLSGINSALFSFGQTGSGKTWTMQGDWQGSLSEEGRSKLEVEGISAMALSYVLQTLHSRFGQSEEKWVCECSILEVYNDSVCDLLSRSTSDLCLREDPSKGVWAEGATMLRLRRREDVMKVIKTARSRLRFSSTAMNLRSSRSHLVITVFLYLEDEERSAERKEERIFRQSRLTLVDLAGNEKVNPCYELSLSQALPGEQVRGIGKDLPRGHVREQVREMTTMVEKLWSSVDGVRVEYDRRKRRRRRRITSCSVSEILVTLSQISPCFGRCPVGPRKEDRARSVPILEADVPPQRRYWSGFKDMRHRSCQPRRSDVQGKHQHPQLHDLRPVDTDKPQGSQRQVRVELSVPEGDEERPG